MARPDVADILKHYGIGTDVNTVLQHYGVVGMKWGKRKAAAIPASDDSTKAATLKVKAKQGGPKALSNQELQTLVTRLNLERQYSQLNPKVKSDGQKFLEGALQVAGPMAVDLAADRLGPYAGVAKIIVTEATKTRKK